MITDTLTVAKDDFERRTGWQLKPEGACKGEVCVPLRDKPEGDMVDLESIASQLNMPIVHDEDHGLWAVGPESLNAKVLSTVEAPNLTLPTLDGDTFELHSLRGKKVILVAWSPY